MTAPERLPHENDQRSQREVALKQIRTGGVVAAVGLGLNLVSILVARTTGGVVLTLWFLFVAGVVAMAHGAWRLSRGQGDR